MKVRRHPATVAREASDRVAEARARALAEIHATIGLLRGAYVTALPGQDAIYMEKRDEARAYVALTAEPAFVEPATPEEGALDWPLLTADLRAGYAETYWQAAQLVLGRAWMLAQAAGPMEALRMGATRQIEAAQDVADVDAALATFRAQVEGLG